MKAYLEQLLDYNYWANGLILRTAEKLPGEQYFLIHSHGQKSLAKTLGHIMLAEMLWLERMQGKSSAQQTLQLILAGHQNPSVKALYEDWFDLELAMRDFLAGFTEPELLSTFKYKSSEGIVIEDRYVDIFTQLVFHGMQHRAECAVILTDFGHSPGDLDYIIYLRT